MLYFENEDEANAELLDVHLHARLIGETNLTPAELVAIHRHNTGRELDPEIATGSREAIFEHLLAAEIIKFIIVISGQGPEAFGMPEMFTPMQHINANRHLKRLAMIVTDGRYSGVSYGAAIGHVTPEARRGGGILYLQTGDLIQANLRARDLTLLDRTTLRERGEIAPFNGELAQERREIGTVRLRRINERRRMIVPTNRMQDVTDASRGVVPRAVAEEATKSYQEYLHDALAFAGGRA